MIRLLLWKMIVDFVVIEPLSTPRVRINNKLQVQ
jgi:hypothetical protein